MSSGRARTTAIGVLAALILTACSGGGDQTRRRPSAPTIADHTTAQVEALPTASPADLDLAPRALRRAARKARRARSSCFAVVREGQVAGAWNWGMPQDRPRQVFSVTKSITSALVGIALGDGDLALDDRVAKYVPQWRGTPSADVTIRNLLSNDSGRFWSEHSDYIDMLAAPDRTRYAVGLDQQFPPGTTWAYNNAAIQVLEGVLTEATGISVAEYAQERLFGPLGMVHTTMGVDATKRAGAQVFFGVQTTCLDLARFGQLFLDGGELDGEQLIPEDFVAESVEQSSTDLNAAYGFLWWLNRPGLIRGSTDEVGPDGQPLTQMRGQLAPGAPADLFAAIGLGGQIVLVDPGSETIVIRLSKDLRRPEAYGFEDAAEVITTAVR